MLLLTKKSALPAAFPMQVFGALWALLLTLLFYAHAFPERLGWVLSCPMIRQLRILLRHSPPQARRTPWDRDRVQGECDLPCACLQ